MYASKVNGNGSDVTMVITYPQKLQADGYDINLGLNVSNLKLVGQVENNYTFLCWDDNSDPPQLGTLLEFSSYSLGYPKQLLLENIETLCNGPLSIDAIDSVILTGFIGQGLGLSIIKTVHIEDSTFIRSAGVQFYESIIYIGYTGDMISFTIKNSLLIQKGLRGRPLMVGWEYSPQGAAPEFSILIENTNFNLIRPPLPDQPASMLLNLRSTIDPIKNPTPIISVNFTISKCNFVNYNLTALEVDMEGAIIVKDIYLNILDSKFRVPLKSYYNRQNFVVVSQDQDVLQTNVHTRLDGNSFSYNYNE
jgi:hypothetical protein